MARMTASPKGLIPSLIGRFAGRLRFPQLFVFTAVIFGLDLLVPDLIPLVDEVLLGLITLLLGTWKKDGVETSPVEAGDKPPMKDITPPDR